MKTGLPPEEKRCSTAKHKANCANAKLSTGPGEAGKSRTRFNACTHGLNARLFLPGQITEADRQLYLAAYSRLGPRNALESICISDLLRIRRFDDLCIEAEVMYLYRAPVAERSAKGRMPLALHEPLALARG